MTPDRLFSKPGPPSDALLAEISRDPGPVKPSPLPLRIALGAAPPAALLCLAILAFIGLRQDAAALGVMMTWGASIAQFGLGLVLVWMAARESTPSRRLPRETVRSAAAATLLIVVIIALGTFRESPTGVPTTLSAWRIGVFCGLGATISGVLLIACFIPRLRRSLAASPPLAGALYGAGAGVTVNAGWRLACPISTPSHSLAAHGTAIVLTTILGAVAAHAIAQRVRARHASGNRVG